MTDFKPQADTEATMALDKTALASIQELDPDGSLGLINDIIRTFTRSIPTELAELQTHHQDNEPERVAQTAHRFRSSCLNVGANDMADLLKYLEIKKQEISFDERGLIVNQLNDLAKRVEIELQELNQNLKST